MAKLKDLLEQETILSASLLSVRKQIRNKRLIGHRAVCYGDEYDYGGYQNYLFKDYGRREARIKAEDSVKCSVDGGHIEDVLKGKERREGKVY